MRHLDLSFHGKYLAERNQIDNGKLPHGGYRGSKRHPPSHLSYDKGREFQHRLEEELARVMETEDLSKHGGSPAWSLLVHSAPSYTDESPLIANNLLAASKMEQMQGVNFYHRQSLLPNKKLPRSGGLAYYRPNRMHQYLSATELKDSASEDVNIKYGRPTRTTLLRARQRSNSAPSNQLPGERKKDFTQRLDEVKTAPEAPNTEYLQLNKVRDGESLHSYLTGARYNRANCLDSKSVEHNGLYMPRNNPALGCFFTGPKGQEYLQDYVESPRDDMPTPPSPPPSAKRRPRTAPSYGRRPQLLSPRKPSPKLDSPLGSKYKHLKLNIVGCRLPLVATREPFQPGLRLPKLSEAADLSDMRLDDALDQTYLVNQPLPSPVGQSEISPAFRPPRHVVQKVRHEAEPEHQREIPAHKGTEGPGMDAIRIEGRSTWRPVEKSEADTAVTASVPTAVEEEKHEEKKDEEEHVAEAMREDVEEEREEKREDGGEDRADETASLQEVQTKEEVVEEAETPKEDHAETVTATMDGPKDEPDAPAASVYSEEPGEPHAAIGEEVNLQKGEEAAGVHEEEEEEVEKEEAQQPQQEEEEEQKIEETVDEPTEEVAEKINDTEESKEAADEKEMKQSENEEVEEGETEEADGVKFFITENETVNTKQKNEIVESSEVPLDETNAQL